MEQVIGSTPRLCQGVLRVSFLLFAVTLYYFSPVLTAGALPGVINGSVLIFSLMLLSSLILGRTWCGWACPTGALQELAAPATQRRLTRGEIEWIKWAVEIP